MTSAETVNLPRDRKGQTLRLGYEVLVFNGTSTCARGEVTTMTLVRLWPVTWYVDLHMGAVGDRRYRTSCGGFDPRELERIVEDSDGI